MSQELIIEGWTKPYCGITHLLIYNKNHEKLIQATITNHGQSFEVMVWRHITSSSAFGKWADSASEAEETAWRFIRQLIEIPETVTPDTPLAF